MWPRSARWSPCTPISFTLQPLTTNCHKPPASTPTARMRETGEIYRQAADGILGMGNNANALHSQVGGAWRRQGPHTSCACWLCTLRWVAVLRMVCPADSWHPPNPTPRSSLPAVRSTVCSPSASASPPAARCCSVMWRRRVASRCLTRRCCQAPRPTMSCGWRPSALGGNPCASSRWVLYLHNFAQVGAADRYCGC